MTQELLLMGLLLNGKMHGYQLNKQFMHSFSFCTDMKKSTAYYSLNKLEKNGFIDQEKEQPGKRPERRVYELNDLGRSHFLTLLRNSLEGFSRTYYEDDVGIAFMEQLPVSEVLSLLNKKKKEAESILHQLQHIPLHSGTWAFVIDRNIRHLQTDISWLTNLIKQYKTKNRGPGFN